MNPADLRTLNDRFAIADHLSFRAGPGGLPVAEIGNAHAAAAVALQGGHTTSFRPHEHEPVLWVSRYSNYAAGKAIRGGIPVCWPWFGPHPTDADKPSHGFVRAAMWSVLATGVAAGEETLIRLGIADDAATRDIWPHAFDLQIAITVGPALHVDLVARNTGDAAFTCGGALHSYFSVSDVASIAIHGLDGCSYIDQLDPAQPRHQRGPVTIDAEIDRIYLDTTAACTIDDPGLERRIRIAKSGSRSTVVWNPWVAKAKRMPDFGDEEYTSMVCVETANAKDDIVTVAPGGEHRLSATISVEPY